MRKRQKSTLCMVMLMILVMLVPAQSLAASPSGAVSAVPSGFKILLDGKDCTLSGYNIGGNTYFKLRDVAKAVESTGKKFEVDYDTQKHAINITSQKSYTSEGGEMQAIDSKSSKTAKLSSSLVYVDGKKASLTAYVIDGKSYFKLKDLGETLGFEVSWYEISRTIGIDTIMNPVVNINLAAEPETLDPTYSSGVDEMTYVAHTFEGLTTTDQDGKIVPGAAQSWETNKDMTVYTFHLRKEGKWSDGKPVTAKDFVYAWKRMIHPDTWSYYGMWLYPVKNAQEIYNEQMPVESLGVKAVDDYTLEVTMEASCPQFLSMTNLSGLYPLRDDIVPANTNSCSLNSTWWADPATYVGNGPYRMTQRSDRYIYMKKSDSYWNAQNISDVDLRFTLIADENIAYESFKRGELDFLNIINVSDYDEAKKTGALHSSDAFSNYFYLFNTEKAPFDNPKVRKALSLAINRQVIIDEACQDERAPAGAFVPAGVIEPDGKDFRFKGGNYYGTAAEDQEANIKEAKRLLAEAGYPNGKGMPTIQFCSSDAQIHVDIAKQVQKMWKESLGVNMEIHVFEWGWYFTALDSGEWDVAKQGWVGDYLDPGNFLAQFVSGNDDSINSGKYKNAAFDKLVEQSRTEVDLQKRMELLHKAEDIFIGEDMAIMPIAYYKDSYVMSSRLTGVVHNPLGIKYFMWVQLK